MKRGHCFQKKMVNGTCPLFTLGDAVPPVFFMGIFSKRIWTLDTVQMTPPVSHND